MVVGERPTTGVWHTQINAADYNGQIKIFTKLKAQCAVTGCGQGFGRGDFCGYVLLRGTCLPAALGNMPVECSCYF